MGFFATWVVGSIAMAATIFLVPGITAVGDAAMAPIFAALALALINATIKPIAQLLSLPLTIVTLGIFYIVVNASMLELASWLSRNVFHAGIAIESFGAAFVGAIVLSIVSMMVSGALGLDEDE